MKPFPSRSAAVLVIALHAASCATWRPIVGSPLGTIQAEDLPVARVTLVSGEHVVLREPRVTSDSIVGFEALQSQSNDASFEGARIAVPVSSVRTIEERVPAIDGAARTVGRFVVGGVAAATVSLYVLCFLKYVCG